MNFVHYLLTCVPYARRGRGGKAAFMPMRILGSGSGWKILAIALCPYINLTPFSSVCAPSTKANSSLVVYFVSNLPPPPSHQPLHTLGKVHFDYDCLMTAVLLPCLKRVKILHPRGKFRAADHVCFKVPFLSVDRGRSERFPVKYTRHHVAVLWNLKCSLPNMFAESWRKFKAQDKTQCTNHRRTQSWRHYSSLLTEKKSL